MVAYRDHLLTNLPLSQYAHQLQLFFLQIPEFKPGPLTCHTWYFFSYDEKNQPPHWYFKLFEYHYRIALPYERRFTHTHILGPTGSGKTQLLQSLILEDLRHKCSVVVIDSQGDLIHNILSLDIPLERIVYIDPTDIEYPLALNIFDIEAHGSPLEREKHINGVIELLSYVFGAVLGAELTQKQGVVLNFVLRLLILIPGSTIHTLRDIFAKGVEPYARYVAQLSITAQEFFSNFDAKEYADTRTQVTRRLYGILENPTIERLFSFPRSRLNLKAEMDAGKVILINTAKDLLKQTSPFFGRFFISLITQAALERAGQTYRRPTFVYIDEAQEYIDQNISTILEQCRKYKLGLTIAHQQLSQLPDSVKSSVMTNTGIKFVASASGSDARALSADMRAEPKQLMDTPPLHFNLYMRGLTRAVPVKVQAGLMEHYAVTRDWNQLRESMRARYAQPRGLPYDPNVVDVEVREVKDTPLLTLKKEYPPDDVDFFNAS